MDEIEKRLRESTDACIKGFEEWLKQSKSLESREQLMEAMHEVRKVVSRLEIEIAISERDRLGSRPIPIPPHRSQRKRAEGSEEGDFNGNEGFDADEAAGSFQGNNEQNHQPRRQQHQGGRGRRPMHNRDRGGNGGGGGNGNSDNPQ